MFCRLKFLTGDKMRSSMLAILYSFIMCWVHIFENLCVLLLLFVTINNRLVHPSDRLLMRNCHLLILKNSGLICCFKCFTSALCGSILIYFFKWQSQPSNAYGQIFHFRGALDAELLKYVGDAYPKGNCSVYCIDGKDIQGPGANFEFVIVISASRHSPQNFW